MVTLTQHTLKGFLFAKVAHQIINGFVMVTQRIVMTYAYGYSPYGYILTKFTLRVFMATDINLILTRY